MRLRRRATHRSTRKKVRVQPTLRHSSVHKSWPGKIPLAARSSFRFAPFIAREWRFVEKIPLLFGDDSEGSDPISYRLCFDAKESSGSQQSCDLCARLLPRPPRDGSCPPVGLL